MPSPRKMKEPVNKNQSGQLKKKDLRKLYLNMNSLRTTWTSVNRSQTEWTMKHLFKYHNKYVRHIDFSLKCSTTVRVMVDLVRLELRIEISGWDLDLVKTAKV